MADDNRDSFTMRPGARNASGYVLHGRQPEAPQGRDYANGPDDFGQVAAQDRAKQTPDERPDRRGAYNHRPEATRP
jgi:hypothetical protein